MSNWEKRVMNPSVSSSFKHIRAKPSCFISHTDKKALCRLRSLHQFSLAQPWIFPYIILVSCKLTIFSVGVWKILEIFFAMLKIVLAFQLLLIASLNYWFTGNWSDCICIIVETWLKLLSLCECWKLFQLNVTCLLALVLIDQISWD